MSEMQLFAPHPALQQLVCGYWYGTFVPEDEQPLMHRVMPNGVIEVIIHLTDNSCLLTKEEERKTSGTLVIGLRPRPYEVKFTQPVEVIGIRLHPDGLKPLFGMHPAELLDNYNDDDLPQRIRNLADQLREVTAAARIGIINQFLLSSLGRYRKQPEHSVLLLARAKKWASQKELMEAVPLSPRQLQRRVRNEYGITLSDYLRLLRLNAIHRYLLGSEEQLTGIAHALEFTDQAHFIREYKQFTGLTPGRFRQRAEEFLVNP